MVLIPQTWLQLRGTFGTGGRIFCGVVCVRATRACACLRVREIHVCEKCACVSV